MNGKVRHAGSMSSNADGLDVWFAGAQWGEPAAMDGLLRAVFPTAQRFAARSCLSREDAEDAVQDALTALVRRVGALRAAEVVTSWLFVTIRHACLRRVPGVILVPLDASRRLPGRTSPAGWWTAWWWLTQLRRCRPRNATWLCWWTCWACRLNGLRSAWASVSAR